MPTNDSSSPVSCVISGKVLHKESASGIADLMVELFDLDGWADPEASVSPSSEPGLLPNFAFDDVSILYKRAMRVGAVITDSAGGFVLEVLPGDINVGRENERRSDLLLLVLAPDEPGLDLRSRVIHLTRDVRFNAGSKEAYVIRLPTKLLVEKQIPLPDAGSSRAVKNEVDAYVEQRKREKEFNAGAAAYHRAEREQEREARSAFRQKLIKKLGMNFSTSGLTGVMVADDDSIEDKNLETVLSGVRRANTVLATSTGSGVAVTLYLTPADIVRLQPYFDGATGDFVDIPEADIGGILFAPSDGENPGALLVHNNPIAKSCFNESASNKCAKLHTGLTENSETSLVDDPTSGTDTEINEGRVLEYVDRLVRHIPAPDMILRPELTPKRADGASLAKAVGEFSLPKGPAEVPAYYDFSSLQIAFDHVWKQLFDEAIPNLAYTANVLGQQNLGVEADEGFYTIHQGFEANEFLHWLNPVDVPPSIARLFDVTKEEFNELSPALRQELIYIATDIHERIAGPEVNHANRTFTHKDSRISDLRNAQALTEQGERILDTVRHGEYHTLHKTLRDLNARLSGKYEFTVFAADKDHHSVNFGLMTTYRQQWTPVTIQAGKLLKSIPLSPKEKREYSVKVNRREKRSDKEAKKNNRSITTEQNSTSRVEADIMAKAQNKTNFGLAVEGDFSVGIYEGKATTTFGVEALSESSQSRKDFREAVLKAAQEYKDEINTEVTTETEYSSESTESATIVNPNDELAVTYLFYELEKRYRLSERIHRVMPVVLVAQEVPSPEQITPAWVLAHDWIINRHLLDDSFRPTLVYIANHSVGDDFGLRELKKNLRQQRNLVETLRIEFSAASLQADNRYKALEAAIASRIDEEHREATDGLVNDIGDFFGTGRGVGALFGLVGGGNNAPDPEAMKARELATKDAHQYALEKAEKAAIALKQEVSTLHQLTDQYNKTLQVRLDNETKVRRLLVHIRNNIFYYMQAIWRMEPLDQRYLRLHKVNVPLLELESRSYRIKVEPEEDDIFARFREPGTERHQAVLHGTLKHNAAGTFDTIPLVEVADLDTLLGFKGNYMIFPMKSHNALTEFMAAPYIDRAFGAMDPDELSNVNLDEFSRYVCCLHQQLSQTEFAEIKDHLRAWLTKLMATRLRNGDEITVPTGSLFIQSLVDPNPILEEFKLKHRELDVYKVQEEVRRAELENLRLVARLLNAEHDDPDVEKKIVIEGVSGSIVVPPEV